MDELKLAQMSINEDDHLFLVFGEKRYRGWYRYIVDNIVDEKGGIKIIEREMCIRFRLPEVLPIYNVARRFTMEERQVGIHRMLVGKDLKEELEQMLQHESVNEYLETLSEDQVKDIMSRASKVVTFDCNKIPYFCLSYKLLDRDDISKLENSKEELKRLDDYENAINQKIKLLIAQHPDYIGLFIDVLNSKKSIVEVERLSNGMISCEFTSKDALNDKV